MDDVKSRHSATDHPFLISQVIGYGSVRISRSFDRLRLGLNFSIGYPSQEGIDFILTKNFFHR